jgi:hypothetical protein
MVVALCVTATATVALFLYPEPFYDLMRMVVSP